MQDSLENDVILSTPLHLDTDAVKLPAIELNAANQKDNTVEEKQFKCDICNKSYNTKAILKKHKKIHGREEEFRCNLCSRGFKNNDELERHNRIHLGIRPYSCHLCANTFSEEASLKTHMKRYSSVCVVSRH